MPTLTLNVPKPKKFKITCVASGKSGGTISFDVEAPDAKSAIKKAQAIIMLGKYSVGPA